MQKNYIYKSRVNPLDLFLYFFANIKYKGGINMKEICSKCRWTNWNVPCVWYMTEQATEDYCPTYAPKGNN